MTLVFITSGNLKRGYSRNFGRNSSGKITARHRGGGHFRKYRPVGVHKGAFSVIGFEYDPFRSVNLAVVLGLSRLSIAFISKVEGIVLGSFAATLNSNISHYDFFLNVSLDSVPVGSFVNNISSRSLKAQFIRSAGCSGQLVFKSGNRVCIKLPSGSLVFFNTKCRTVKGSLAGSGHRLGLLRKAGESRWQGRRPHIRGVAMNPVDHPHGGGEGKTSGGRPSVSPWGLLSKNKN